MRSCVFASTVLGASAGFCCYDGCGVAPASCNSPGDYCSSKDTCGTCGGEWCGDSPSPFPPPPPPPPPSPPPSGLSLYCPSVDDLTVAYCDEGPNKDMPCPQLTDRGWTILGGGGAATKSAFNILGGYVEYDIDLSNVDSGVNANIYTISPVFSGSEFNKENDYCDGAQTGADWCMELDWIESNGKCGGAATIHTIEGLGNDGCTSWGCRVSEHYGRSKFHMKIEYDQSGAWTITRDGQVLGDWNPSPDGRAWNYMKQMHEERGTVIYSSEWTGWVPVDDCGTNPGDLYGSSVTISNLVVSGSVVQGPEPTKCQSEVSV